MSGLQPALNTQLPPFHAIEPEQFQELARDVLAVEPDVTAAEVYGTRGQSQFGIDILAYLRDDRIDVAQCKRFQTITAEQIAEASAEFLKHLKRWQEHDLHRFILITSADLTDRHLSDQVLIERARFRQLGIAYEAWGPKVLSDKLRPHRALAEKYFREGFVDILCGTTMYATQRETAYLAAQLTDTVKLVEDDANTDFSHAQDAFRTGNYARTAEILALLTAPPPILRLSSDTRARIYTLQARYYIAIDDPKKAEESLGLAEREPGSTPIVEKTRFVLELRNCENPSAILTALADKPDDGLQELRAAIFFGFGDQNAANEILDALLAKGVFTPEVLRLKALVSLSRFELETARGFAERATAATAVPSEGAKSTLAIVDYWTAVQLHLARPSQVLWPSPVEAVFIRLDDAANASLRRAAAAFNALGAQRPPGDRVQVEMNVWELASLALLAERSVQETARLDELADRLKFVSNALGWFMSRLVTTDLENLFAFLENKSARNEELQSPEVLTLSSLYVDKGREKDSLRVLDAHEDMLIRSGATSMLILSRARAFAGIGDYSKAQIEASKASDAMTRFYGALLIAEQQARDGGDLSTLMESLAKATDPAMEIHAVAVRYEFRDFERVAGLGAPLLTVVDTAKFTEIVARSQGLGADFQGAISTLLSGAARYPGGTLPKRLKFLVANALVGLGRVTEAIAELESCRSGPFDSDLEYRLMTAYGMIGDFPKLTRQAQNAIAADSSFQSLLLGLAQLLADRDRELAASLLRLSVRDSVDADTAPSIYALSLALEVKAVTDLVRPLVTIGKPGSNAPIIAASVEEAPVLLMTQHQQLQSMLNDYAKGRIPLYAIAERDNELFLKLFFEVPGRNLMSLVGRAPVFAVHGSRPTGQAYSSLVQAATLYLDVTTLVLADHLGILGQLIAIGKQIVISHDAVRALLNVNFLLQPVQRRAEHIEKTVAALPLDASAARNIHWEAESKPVAVANSVQALLTDCRAARILSDDEWRRAGERFSLTDADVDTAPNNLQRGEGLRLDTVSAYALAEADLLARLQTVFLLSVDEAGHRRAEQQLTEFERRSATKARLRRIIDDLSVTINAGSVQLTPQNRPAEEIGEAIGLRSIGLVIADLDQIQRGPAPAVVAIDDRSLNSAFQTQGGLPIVTLAEILLVLKDLGAFGIDEYYDILASARELMILFLPISVDELFTALAESRLDGNGNLVESRRLSAIRIYIERAFEVATSAELSAPLSGGLNEAFFFNSTISVLLSCTGRVASADLASAPRLRYLEGLRKGAQLRLNVATNAH
jgi:hypothetical protein